MQRKSKWLTWSVIVASCISLAISTAASARTDDASSSEALPPAEIVPESEPRWGPGEPQSIRLTPLNPPRRARKPKRRPLANWDAIAQCESGGRWHYNGPSGFDGGLQFLPSTWTSVMRASGYRFSRYAWQATRKQQIAAAEYLIGPMRANPWRQWPYCWRFA
jgi:hypothetical protein